MADSLPKQIDPSLCPPNILDKFWERVDRSGDCWEWVGAKASKGYGRFSAYRDRDGKYQSFRAHRFIDFALNGEFREEDGMYTLHSCDNPLCVRPSHLFRGSKKDNSDDKWEKGRQFDPPRMYGKDHPNNRLTDDQVREIKTRRLNGENGQVLAKEYGVTDVLIYAIANGKRRQSAFKDGK